MCAAEYHRIAIHWVLSPERPAVAIPAVAKFFRAHSGSVPAADDGGGPLNWRRVAGVERLWKTAASTQRAVKT
jgi:hypothetical protein